MQALSMAELIAMADDECRQLWDNLLLKYTETDGLPQLREEIVKQHYPSLKPTNLNIVCPQEGIFLSMNTLLSPTDHVIAVGPAYQSLTAVAESIGCEVSLWNCKEAQGNHAMPLVFDVADLDALVQPNSKLLVVNFPHNPTGFLPTQDDWRHIVAFARKHDLFLFADEMYHGLECDVALQLPPACTVYEKGISLCGMSKTYAMPGVRVGWVASQHEPFMTKFATLKDYTTICNSAPSEILALIALRNRSTIVERSLAIIRANRGHVEKFMEAHRDIFAYEAPIAGPIAFPKLIGGERTDAGVYAQHLVDKYGILILPGDKYDQSYNNRFRLSLARTNMPEILALWEKDFAPTTA
jgi:aspartate/methionine/tyrosine aminotransferase